MLTVMIMTMGLTNMEHDLHVSIWNNLHIQWVIVQPASLYHCLLGIKMACRSTMLNLER